MNSLQLVQAAVLFADRQRKSSVPPDQEDALRQYWADSQCRLQRWQEMTHRFDVEIRNTHDLTVIRGVEYLPAVEELIFADTLTTVFTGLLDLHQQKGEQNPIGQSVLNAARQARGRSLALLDIVAQRNSRLRKPEPAILQACRGRQRAELWTDILVSYLPTDIDAAHALGFSAKRIETFRANIESLNRQGKLEPFTQKLCRDIGVYFKQHPPTVSGNEELNCQIFDSIETALGHKLSSRPTLAGRGI